MGLIESEGHIGRFRAKGFDSGHGVKFKDGLITGSSEGGVCSTRIALDDVKRKYV